MLTCYSSVYLPEQQADQSQQQESSKDRHHDNPQEGARVHLLPQVWINVNLNLQKNTQIQMEHNKLHHHLPNQRANSSSCLSSML